MVVAVPNVNAGTVGRVVMNCWSVELPEPPLEFVALMLR